MNKLTLVVAAVYSLAATAQEKKEMLPMAAPTPSKDLEAWMKPVEGTWSCDTRMMAGAMGPDSPEMTTKTKVKFMKDKESNGVWFRGEWSAPKTKTSPAMSGAFLISHDDANRVLTQVAWDAMGGASMGTGTITGDTLTWTGEAMMMGKKSKLRETMTKTGPRTATHKVELDQGKGFQVTSEDTCTKETSKS